MFVVGINVGISEVRLLTVEGLYMVTVVVSVGEGEIFVETIVVSFVEVIGMTVETLVVCLSLVEVIMVVAVVNSVVGIIGVRVVKGNLSVVGIIVGISEV